jgi:hypothetical protein
MADDRRLSIEELENLAPGLRARAESLALRPVKQEAAPDRLELTLPTLIVAISDSYTIDEVHREMERLAKAGETNDELKKAMTELWAGEVAVSPGEAANLLANSDIVLLDGARRLRLRDEPRGALLTAMTDGARGMLKAVAREDYERFDEITDDPVRLPSAWLRAFLIGQAGDIERAPYAEARAAHEALQRLRRYDGLKRAPTLEKAAQCLEWAELIEPLRVLIGATGGWDGRESEDRFVGRRAQLQFLREFVDELAAHSGVEAVQRAVKRSARKVRDTFGARREGVCVIEARGGLGKSALIAKFVLDHALAVEPRVPFIYLDFDRAALEPRNPHLLLAEGCRQLALQFPACAGELRALQAQIGSKPFQPSETASTDRELFAAFARLVRARVTNGRALLLILDTMEVVQFDVRALEGVTAFVNALYVEPLPELRVVAAGRADIPELREAHNGREEGKKISLPSLSAKEAAEMATVLGRSLLGENNWQAKWSVRLVGSSSRAPERREPLSIRIAVDILRQTPEPMRDAVSLEIAEQGEASDGSFIAGLYERRVLSHIRGSAARKLAWPGLVMRRLTREIVREVLSGLCAMNEAEADRAFDELAKETWVITRTGAGANEELRHRTDLRARTLPFMRRKSEAFNRVNQAAITYYAARKSLSDANYAEWLYHRLLGGEATERIDADWYDALLPHFKDAADDFRGAEAELYLLARASRRLLAPGQISRLPPGLAFDHIAKAGAALINTDDQRIRRVLLDLSARPLGQARLSAAGAMARYVVAINTGVWRDTFPPIASGPWETYVRLAAAFVQARTSGADFDGRYGERLADVWEAEGRGEGRRSNPEESAWLAETLAAASLLRLDFYEEVDEALANALTNPNTKCSMNDLRLAVIFGNVAARAARPALTRSWKAPTTFSAREIWALADKNERAERVLRGALDEPLRTLGLTWKDLRDGRPRRLTSHAMCEVLADHVFDLIGSDTSQAQYNLRRYLAARDRDWIAPLGYAAARAYGGAKPSLVIEQELRGHHVGSRRADFTAPKDWIEIMRAADEAGDLAGIAALAAEHAPGEDGDLVRLLGHHNAWRGQLDLAIDGRAPSTPLAPVHRSDPPAPGVVINQRDLQKGRWGGRTTASGRSVRADLLEIKRWYFVATVTVSSTDGSPLEGPVVFHLHDTFPRSVITIRKIREGQHARLEEVAASGAFTLGVQVRDAEGNWVGLELDLAELPDMPKALRDDED